MSENTAIWIVLVIVGIGLFAYGASTAYGLAGEDPYHYTVTEVDENESEGLTVVDFDEISQSEQDIFLSMRNGETYVTDQQKSPIDAEGVRHEGELFEVYLGEIREPAVLILYLFYGIAVLGVGVAGVGVWKTKEALQD